MFDKFTRTARVARVSKWPFYPTQLFALSTGPKKKGVWNLEDVENIHMSFKKPLELFYIHQFVPWRFFFNTIIYKKKKVNNSNNNNNNNNNNNKTDISILFKSNSTVEYRSQRRNILRISFAVISNITVEYPSQRIFLLILYLVTSVLINFP